jgi:hypothetical protein
MKTLVFRTIAPPAANTLKSELQRCLSLRISVSLYNDLTCLTL